jgi:phage-related baseplate assembly protein
MLHDVHFAPPPLLLRSSVLWAMSATIVHVLAATSDSLISVYSNYFVYKTVFARDHLCDTRRSVLTACQENESHHKITAFRIARCWLGAGSPKFVWFQPRRSEERSAWRERTRDERGNERQDALCAQVEQFTPTRES